ncbi:hypothetical protein [Pseudomonas sp. Ant30-3]|uniref:hypothetical protein n=1 Tax=Pseudomonas sp. Ant30-3 TaxID=1488328 RepID=UPI00051838A8|nr:hypothetical protein [Pseudomonas sp. Ant30-3]
MRDNCRPVLGVLAPAAMFGLPSFDERIDMIGKFLQLRSASCDGEIVEVRERPDMLPNRVIGRVLLVERLDVTLDLRAQPQGLDAVNRLERPKVMFQHDNHLSRKAKEMSCCA